MLTFKSITSASKGVTVQTVSEPFIAAVKQKIHNPGFMDGSLDYSAIGGELFYEDKVIEYTFRFKCANLAAFNTKLTELAGWLTGKGTLVTPSGKTYNNARCYGGATIAPQFYGTYGEFNVSFAVPPFAVGESKPS